MKKDSVAFIFSCVAIGLLIFGKPVLGQDEDVYGEDEALETSGDEIHYEASEVERDNRLVEKPDAPTQVQKEHRVIPGDTLWDLCAAYLNNPWYWPRVWSYNPELSNPHWIYPGQIVKFFPSGALPSEMLVSNEIDIPESIPELPEEKEAEEMVKFAEGKDIVRVKEVTSLDVNRDSFVTKEEIETAGYIKASREEKENLSQFDSIYIEFADSQNVEVGRDWLVVRTIKKIHHPNTGDFVGYHTQVLGVAHVLEKNEAIASAMIKLSYNPILRGDRVIPWNGDLNRQVNPKPNSAQVEGSIVDSKISMTSFGERNIVFIDRGTSHGVQEGNVFDCVRNQDGMVPLGSDFDPTRIDEGLPTEVFGRIMVVDARDTASTGVVVSSLKEMYPGDRVRMTVQ